MLIRCLALALFATRVILAGMQKQNDGVSALPLPCFSQPSGVHKWLCTHCNRPNLN